MDRGRAMVARTTKTTGTTPHATRHHVRLRATPPVSCLSTSSAISRSSFACTLEGNMAIGRGRWWTRLAASRGRLQGMAAEMTSTVTTVAVGRQVRGAVLAKTLTRRWSRHLSGPTVWMRRLQMLCGSASLTSDRWSWRKESALRGTLRLRSSHASEKHDSEPLTSRITGLWSHSDTTVVEGEAATISRLRCTSSSGAVVLMSGLRTHCKNATRISSRL